jgi:glycosyltransferase involved in cell wall biosynthesis
MNPYQDELARGLENAGVDVVTGDHTDPLPILQALVTHGRPDVLHLHWAHSFLDTDSRVLRLLLGVRLLLELLVVRLLGVSLVWTVHNRFTHDQPHHRVERRVRRGLCHLSDSIIVHGETARDTIVSAYGLSDRVAKRIRVVPHGNYIQSYENTLSRAAARDRLNLPADATVFLNIGNIRPYKNVPELVDTFRTLETADARLLVVGQPPADPTARAQLVEQCERDTRVRHEFGYVPGDELQVYLNAADAVVLPFSEVLTSGSVALALSFGRPVIAPELGCIPETVGECDRLLYDPAAPDGLRDALDRALTMDLDAAGNRARRRATQLDWEAIGQATAAVYQQSAGQSRPVAQTPTPFQE